MNKNLVIAANGLVGAALKNRLLQLGQDVVGTCLSRPASDLQSLDITDQMALQTFVKNINPTHIYLAANFPGGVNRCEENHLAAENFHLSPLNTLAQLAQERNFALVYYSTDYVFADHSQPRSEGDARNPLNFYGHLKASCEDFIIKNFKRSLILRTTNVYGYDANTKTPNYLMQLMQSIQQGKIFVSTSSMMATPTYVYDLAQISIELVQAEKWGLYHIVGDEFMSRYTWALTMAKKLGLDSFLIVDEPLKNTLIKRPLRLQLSNAKLKSVLNYKLKTLDEGMDEIKSKIEHSGSRGKL